MTTATQAAAPAGTLLGRVERVAWRVPLPTRRLFVTLALALAGTLAAAGLVAALVASRNAATIDRATDQGLGVARAATAFRTHLANADALAAATLISGGLEAPESRAEYDEELLAASQALTDAALRANADDTAAIKDLGDGLVRYAGLVETSRANSRLGYPVGAAYLGQARDLANDDLAPRAEQLGRVGEQRMARAANSVGGPLGALAVVLLLLALAVLIAGAVLVAGRTRRMLHPALLGATLVLVGALVVVTQGIVGQGRELRAAATEDIDAYVAANEVANDLSDLRVVEIEAVAARGSGAERYDSFTEAASELRTAVNDAPGDRDDIAALAGDLRSYVAAVDGDQGVRVLDLDEGDNQAAADATLTGPSFQAFSAADDQATANVQREDAELADRFAAAGDADVAPLLPLVLGIVAGGLAAAGILARGRRYR